MNVPFSFRGQVEQTPGGTWIAQTFQAVINAISATWDRQHDSDGSHTTLTIGSSAGPLISTGSGSPEGRITAPMGSLYLRTDGSTSTTLYVKTTGRAATGWTAK